jgi:hypothetical protein
MSKYVTPWSRVLLEKLRVTLLVKKFPAKITEPEGSLPCSHGSAIEFSPAPDSFSPHPSTLYP